MCKMYLCAQSHVNITHHNIRRGWCKFNLHTVLWCSNVKFIYWVHITSQKQKNNKKNSWVISLVFRCFRSRLHLYHGGKVQVTPVTSMTMKRNHSGSPPQKNVRKSLQISRQWVHRRCTLWTGDLYTVYRPFSVHVYQPSSSRNVSEIAKHGFLHSVSKNRF